MADALIAELENLALGQLPPASTLSVTYTMAGWNLSENRNSWLWLPWYTPYCVPLWLIAWLWIGRWFLRRHRQQMLAWAKERESARKLGG